MFGIDWSEMLVVLAVAIIVIGPKDMPRILYQLGKLVRKFKIFMSDIQVSLDHIMREEELNDITREANKPGGDNLQFDIDRQIEIEKKKTQGHDGAG